MDGVRAAWTFRPCDELAGDTMGVFALDPDHLGAYVLDVSGHGVQSALLSVTLSRLLTPNTARSTLLREENGDGVRTVPPAEVLTRLNRQFPMDPDTHQYFTIVYGILDRRSGVLTYAAGGHPPPIVLGPHRQPEARNALDPPVGFVPGLEFQQAELALKPGERLYFYTDGIPEARAPGGEQYSMDRLRAVLKKALGKDLEDSLQAVYESVRQWNHDRFDDDLTLLGVSWREDG
jgi:sigma-B regulation protein RsbU (phosphoserine phosphatase)